MLQTCGIVGVLYHKRNYRPKHVELVEVINKLSLLRLVGCLCIVSMMHGHTNITFLTGIPTDGISCYVCMYVCMCVGGGGGMGGF